MATYIDVHNQNAEEISGILEKLPVQSGACLFIDLTSSTEIKYKTGIEEWVMLLKNTFSILKIEGIIKDNIIKYIGDEIMIFIPDADFHAENQSISDYSTLLEEVYAMVDILNMLEVNRVFLKCKVALHYCTQVYNITFFKGYNDYYGKGIDLTSRLMQKSKENRIVLSEAFYQKAVQDMKSLDLSKDHRCLGLVSAKYVEDFSGIPDLTEYRIIDIH